MDSEQGQKKRIIVNPDGLVEHLINAPVRTSMEELHTRIDKFQDGEQPAVVFRDTMMDTNITGPDVIHGAETGRFVTDHPNMVDIDRVTGEPLVQIRRSPHISRPIDNTALADYMACPRKFYYGMVLDRRRQGTTPPPLAFGTSWHSALEAHYKTGGDRASVEMAIVRSWQQHDRPDDHRTMERVMTCYEQYLKQWGDHGADSARNGRTVGFPENPMVEIPVEIAAPGWLHPYTGKIDRIIEINGLYYVEDHKTTSQLGANYFQQYDPNNQMMGYAVLAQKLTGLRIAGVRINALGVLKTQTKFAREIVSYSKERLTEWEYNYNAWIRRIESSYEVLEAAAAVRGPENYTDDLVLSAFPHNFMACAGRYGMCQYASVCAFQPARRGYVLDSEFQKKEWDPMEVFAEGSGDAE